MVDLCLCCVMNYVLGDEWFEQTKNAQETCNSQHIWDSQKAVVSSKTILELFCGGDVEIEEKRRETENKHLPPTHRDAIYLRKKQVVLMPRWCLCPTIYGSLCWLLDDFSFSFFQGRP
jgi:hypothetical protein